MCDNRVSGGLFNFRKPLNLIGFDEKSAGFEMKIQHIQISNYRSIKELDIDVSDFLVLIGANNSGKSNILKALNFFFQGSEKIAADDVFSFFDGRETQVSVIVTFDSLNEQERNTFNKYILNDGTIIIRKNCQVIKNDNNKLNCSNPEYNGWVEDPDRWYLKESAFEKLSTREKREKEAANEKELAPLLEVEGRFTKDDLEEFQDRFKAEHKVEIKFSGKFEDTPLLGKQNVVSGILPEIIFIQAIRDLSDETKVNSKTLLGKLLLNVLDVMIENDTDFQNAMAEVEASIERLNDKEAYGSPIVKLESELTQELSGWGVSTSINVDPPNIKKLFELGTSLNVDDGVMTGAESKGNGLQRAIIFGLVKVIANHNKITYMELSSRAKCESQIFVIEEAELYLHPHKQREFYSNLKKIADDDNSQVILTTHSSHFVRMNDYKNLALIRKPAKEIGTIINQCCFDIFDPSLDEKQHYKLVHYINPDNGDMFFARKVILVEGETEKVVLPYLAERLELYKPDISIIACGAKHNIPLYIKLLNHFDIQYAVIFDEDPMKQSYDNPEKEDAARRTFELNQQINDLIDKTLGIPKMISPNFEGAFSIPKNQGDKLGKGLAALKHFQGKTNDDIPEEMIQLLKKVYS